MSVNEDQARSLAERTVKASIADTRDRGWPGNHAVIFDDMIVSGVLSVYIDAEMRAHESFANMMQLAARQRLQSRN